MRLTKKCPHRASRLKDMMDNYTSHMNGNAMDIRLQGILDPVGTRNKRRKYGWVSLKKGFELRSRMVGK